MPESLRLFALCDAMEWNHLPQAGGIYDQHPDVLEDFMEIFSARAQYEKEKKAKEKRNNPTPKRPSRGK